MSEAGRVAELDRKLGRHARAALSTPLPAAGARRPSDRRLAAADAVLVVGGACGRRGGPSLPQPVARFPLLRRRLRDARRGLHLERHRRPRSRCAGRAHALAADSFGPGERAGGGGFLVLQALIGLLVLVQFNGFTILAGIASLVVVAVYPLQKRVTWWPQIVLGLAFSWGALMGWAAVFGAARCAGVPALCRLDRLGDRLRHDLCASGPRGRRADRCQSTARLFGRARRR